MKALMVFAVLLTVSSGLSRTSQASEADGAQCDAAYRLYNDLMLQGYAGGDAWLIASPWLWCGDEAWGFN